MAEIEDEVVVQRPEIFKLKGEKEWYKIYSILAEVKNESVQKKRWILLDQLHAEVFNLKIEDKEENQYQYLNEFAHVLCKLYFTNILCSRTNQRIAKVLQVLCTKHPEVKSVLSKEIDSLYDVSSDESTIQQVFIIIDSWSLGRSCMEDKLDTLWLHIIGQWSDRMMAKVKESYHSNIISYQDNLQLVIKISLQMFQHFSIKIQHILHVQAKEPSSDQARKNITTIVAFLISVIFSKHLAKECLLLSATSLSLFLNTEPDSSQVINAVTHILHHAGMDLSSSSTINSDTAVTTSDINIILPTPDRQPVTQVALLQAIITASRKNIILHQTQDKSAGLFLTYVVFPTICQLCKTGKIPVVQYLSYEVVKSWMHRVKSLLKDIHDITNSLLFTADSCYTNSILELVWDSLEDPVEGVSISGRNIFGSLLEVHHEEQCIIQTDSNEQTVFYGFVLEKVLAIPWQVKAKYGLLCELLPFVDLNQIFTKSPNLVQEMSMCLRTNQLSSACTEVFKAFLLKSKQEQCSEFQERWIDVLLKSLTSDNQLLAQHTRQYWLPCALKSIPHTHETLLNQLSGNQTNRCHPNLVLSAKLAILKAARSLGIVDSEHLDEMLLRNTLQHQEDNLRLEALGVVCCDVKTSKPLAEVELQLLRECLPHNLNIACPSFRQELFLALKKVLCRIRDSSLFSIKKSYPKVYKKSHLQESEICQLTVTPDIQRALDFIEWMFQLMANSMLPGANYQRQKTALEFLSLMFDTFAVSGNSDKRKGQAPESCRILMMLAERKASWSFYSSRSVHIFLGCLQSSHSEIRELAFDILRKHFSVPFKAMDGKTSDRDFTLHLLKDASRLICSAKTQECESGSILCQLIFESYTAQLKWRFTDIFGEISVQLINDATQDDVCTQFLVELVSEAERQVDNAKNDLGVAAEQGPIHGILLTLCRCISSYLDIIPTNQSMISQSLCTSVQRAIDVALQAIDYLLGVLSKKQDSQNVVCGASFAGLGEAVSDAVSTKDQESNNQTAQQHKKEFIMSCCFLSIKSGCHLLASIVEKSFNLSPGHAPCATLLSSETLTSIGDMFIQIFTQCRLTGVLLSCKLSLMSVCRSFSGSDVECLYTLPRRWIQNVIGAISGDGAASSVTRRSAGLPVLIANILASELPSRRPLTVKYCFDELLKIAFAPIPDVIDLTTDLPQVHAMNILRLLYQDTALGSDVVQFTEQGFILTVNGFASSLWSIRNAATQLFGSLVLRTLGQKRGFQDENQVNSISAKDFFKRFPSLRAFFLEQLESCSSNEKQKTQSFLRPELFPILTLLSKLRPATSDEEENLLAAFIPALTPLSANPVYAVRVLAAQALVPFIPVNSSASKAAEMLRSIPCSPSSISQNRIHGTMLQVHRLVDSVSNPRVNKKASLIMKELRSRSWLGTEVNTCAVTRAEYLTLTLEVRALLSNDTLNETFLKEITADHIVNNRSVHVGLPSLQQALVRANVDITKRDYENVGDNLVVIKQGLGSSQREIRIATLECLNELLAKKHTSITDIPEALTSLISMETDQRCLLLALECFINKNYQPEQTRSEDWTVLWTPILSYTRGSRGSTAQSKAITVLSILIRSIIMQSSDPQQVVSMVTEWSLSLAACSLPWQPEPIRSGAALGLGIAGADVLLWAEKYQDNETVISTVVRVFQTGVILMEDEQDDVRIAASNFGAKVKHHHHDDSDFRGITCSVAMEAMFEHLSRKFYWSSDVWVAMVTLIRWRCSVQDLLAEYVQSSRTLFEQEDCNLYAEPFVTVQLACSHLKTMVDRVFADESLRSDTVKVWCRNWLAEETEKLVKDLDILEKSGIQNGGSLQNPKLFTLRYRLVMMADVITYFTSKVCHPAEVVLLKRVEEVVSLVSRTSTGCHPILYECCSHLKYRNK